MRPRPPDAQIPNGAGLGDQRKRGRRPGLRAGRLLAGASEEELTGVLLAVGPVAGLGRVVGAVPDVASALGYDVEAALLEPDDQ